MKDIILVGFGGHAKSIADSIEQSGEYHIVGYTELIPSCEETAYTYLGTDDVLETYYEKGVKNAVVCVGYLGSGKIRDILYSKLKKIGYELPAIIDKSAIIAEKVYVGEGTYVGKGAIINADAQIDEMCIINTKALIEHECHVEKFSHVAVAAVLCGNVKVRNHAFIGANATVIQGIEVGENCIIGAGSIVPRDVQANKKVYGIYRLKKDDF